MRVLIKQSYGKWQLECLEYPILNLEWYGDLSEFIIQFEKHAELFFKNNPNPMQYSTPLSEEEWKKKSDFQKVGYIGDRVYIAAII